MTMPPPMPVETTIEMYELSFFAAPYSPSASARARASPSTKVLIPVFVSSSERRGKLRH